MVSIKQRWRRTNVRRGRGRNRDMNYVPWEKLWPLIATYKSELIERLGQSVLGIVIFGSVARDEVRADSDIDMLTLIEYREPGIEEVTTKLSVDSQDWPENLKLEHEGIRTRVYNIYKTLPELAENPLILLDIADHGKILYERDNSMSGLLDRFMTKLKELGTRKIVFDDGKWAWDLKPDWVPGEIVDLTL